MKKLSVTPIGSCRITNPLRSDSARRRLDLNLGRVYGFTQTSAEAVQLAHFIQGDFTLTERMRAMLFPRMSASELNATTHEIADLYMVELSSDKVLEVEGVNVQINYYKAHFSEFFSDINRAIKFWSQLRSSSHKEFVAFLEDDPVYRAYGPDDQSLLRSVSVHTTQPDELARDMKELMERLPRVLFVSHCNATTEDGNQLATRAAYVDMVTDVARSIGAELSNPSDLMSAYGQEQSFTDAGTSFTHYSPEFERQLVLEWDACYFQAIRDELGIEAKFDDEAGKIADWVDQINLCRRQNLDEETQSLFARAMADQPHSLELQRLKYEHLLDRSDYHGAKDTFHILEQAQAVDESLAVSLMAMAVDEQHWEDVLEIRDILVQEDAQSIATMEFSALAAEALKQHNEALHCWSGVYNASYGRYDVALKIAENAFLTHSHQVSTDWCMKVLETRPDDVDTLTLLARNLLLVGESQNLKDTLYQFVAIAPDQAICILREAAEADIAVAIAGPLKKLLESNALSQGVRDFSDTLLDKWIRDADQCSQNNDHLNASRYLRAVLDMVPSHVQAATMLKAYWQPWRKEVRNVYNLRKYDEVVSLGEKCLFVLPEIADTLVQVGRAYYQLGKYQQAIEWFRRSVEHDPMEHAAWMFMARCAWKVEDFELAAHAYRQVIAIIPLGDKKDQHLLDDAKVKLARAAILALAKARIHLKSGDTDQAWNQIQVTLDIDDSNEKAIGTAKAIIRQARRNLLESNEEGSGTRIALADSLLEKNPDNSIGLKIKAQELMHLSDYGNALTIWRQYADITDIPGSGASQIILCERQLVQHA